MRKIEYFPVEKMRDNFAMDEIQQFQVFLKDLKLMLI